MSDTLRKPQMIRSAPAIDHAFVMLISSKFSRLAIIWMFIGLALLIGFQNISAQITEMFEIEDISRDVRRRFKLTSRDADKIKPLIRSENLKIAEMYSRFGGDEAEYSSRFWLQLVNDRFRFESGIGDELSLKQAKAIRSARTKLEERLVRYLIEDYVTLLGDVLSFDVFEYNDVTKLLESDADKRHRLLAAHLSNPSVMMREMDKVSRETEVDMRKAMSLDQWQIFLKFTREPELIG